MIIHLSGLSITPHGSRTAKLFLAFPSVLLLAGNTASSLAPAPACDSLEARLLLGLLQLQQRKSFAGIVFTNLSIASYFDTTSHPCNGEERPPFPSKGYPCFVRRLLSARAELMERESRAAPLIRVVLPDSFSKHFPRKLDALAAIWTTHKRNFTGFGGRQLHKMEGVGHFLSWQQAPFK